ncbi:hypothetical protein Mapa_013926 [Marchantia paleacea]|nr:hypothetical protein Mapa_013926 [Marchantia paleacea]
MSLGGGGGVWGVGGLVCLLLLVFRGCNNTQQQVRMRKQLRGYKVEGPLTGC